jgi:Polyketide cyclase / dehydrase and lipid transport
LDITRAVPALESVDERYFDLAPQRFSHSWLIAKPADAVWAELVSEQPLQWCRGLRIRWTSPRPFGVGTTRQAKAMGGLSVGDAYFFIWEEGRRKAFYFTRYNLPVFTSFAEDYLVESEGTDRCRFTWRIALTPRPLGRGPLNKVVFESAFRATGRYFNAA